MAPSRRLDELYAVGIELSNSGVGQPYPVSQVEAMFASILAITVAYGLEPDDVAEHFDWAPGRKIDPATAAAVQGAWRPESTTSSGTWWVVDLPRRMPTPRRNSPAPYRTKGVIDMYVISVSRNGWPGPVDLLVSDEGTRWNQNGNTSTSTTSPAYRGSASTKTRRSGSSSTAPASGRVRSPCCPNTTIRT